VKENMMKSMLMLLASVLLTLFLTELSLLLLVAALSPTAGKRVFQILGRLQQLWYGRPIGVILTKRSIIPYNYSICTHIAVLS
jgi:hypothetical protein